MDPIANMLTILKNAQAVHAESADVPFSKMKLAIAGILKEAGFIGEFERKKKTIRKSEREFISILLKYTNGIGALNGVKLISKPSRRLYMKAREFRKVRSGLGVAVVSTSRGIMTSSRAYKEKVGGEILFEAW